jgi:DNA-binding MarR family transcriptional regulator/predicted GNAT family N-acyltransferase
MNFFDQVGKMAIGSRLRLLTERITEDAAQLYKAYEVDLKPKWWPVFYALSDGQSKTITDIAKTIGHSHPSVSKIISEMVKKGLVKEKKDKADGRRNMVSLTNAGKALHEKIQDQYTDVNQAIETISASANYDLWKAIGEWEFLLDQQSLLQRVLQQKKAREGAAVRIVDYQPEHKQIFRELNEEWITTWFKMEAADYKALDHPEAILDKGGCIVVAYLGDAPVGVCALIKMNDPEYGYEMAKMAVSAGMRGKNIGWLLGNAIIEKARALGTHKIFLESNTILAPAISLYHKLGFKKVTGRPSPYERSNIQMELAL